MSHPFNNNIILKYAGQGTTSNIVPQQNIVTFDDVNIDNQLSELLVNTSVVNLIVDGQYAVCHFSNTTEANDNNTIDYDNSYNSTLLFSPALSIDNTKQINLGVSVYNDCSIDKNLIIANTLQTEAAIKDILYKQTHRLIEGTPVGETDWATRYTSIQFHGERAFLPDDPIPFFYQFPLTYSHMGIIDTGIAYYRASKNDPGGIAYDSSELFYIGNDLKVFDEQGRLLINGLDYIALITDLLSETTTVIDNAFDITLYLNKQPHEIWTVEYDKCNTSAGKMTGYENNFSEYIVATPVDLDTSIYPRAVKNGKPIYTTLDNDISVSKSSALTPYDPWNIRIHRDNITQIIRFDRFVHTSAVNEVSPVQAVLFNAVSYKGDIITLSSDLTGNIIPKIQTVLQSAGLTITADGHVTKDNVNQEIKLGLTYRVNVAEEDIANNSNSIIFEALEEATPFTNTKIRVSNTPIFMGGNVTDPDTNTTGHIIVTIGDEIYTPDDYNMTIDSYGGTIDLGIDLSRRLKTDRIYVRYLYVKDYYLVKELEIADGTKYLLDFNPATGHYCSVESVIEEMSSHESGQYYTDFVDLVFDTRDYPKSIGDYDLSADLDAILYDGTTLASSNEISYPRINSQAYNSVQLLDFYSKYMPSYTLLKRNLHVYLLPTTIDLRVPEIGGYDKIYPIVNLGYLDNVRISFDDNIFNPDSPSYNGLLLRLCIINMLSNNRFNIIDSRTRGGEIALPYFDVGPQDVVAPGNLVITLPASVQSSIQNGKFSEQELAEAIDNYIRAGFGYIVKYDKSAPLKLTVSAKLCETSGSMLLRGESPLCVQFFAEAVGTDPITIVWSFGDQFTSNDPNPVHMYINESSDVKIFSAIATAYDSSGNMISKYVGPITVVPPMNIEIDGEVD